MEGRAWKGFGDWHYPGRSGNGWHGQQGMWWGVRDGHDRHVVQTRSVPRVTHQTETDHGQRDGHTPGLLEGQKHGTRDIPGWLDTRLSPWLAQWAPICSFPASHPAWRGMGSATGWVRDQHPRGIKGPAFPTGADQHSCGMIWGSASLPHPRMRGTIIPMEQHP